VNRINLEKEQGVANTVDFDELESPMNSNPIRFWIALLVFFSNGLGYLNWTVRSFQCVGPSRIGSTQSAFVSPQSKPSTRGTQKKKTGRR
jgi:hypothetical protein